MIGIKFGIILMLIKLVPYHTDSQDEANEIVTLIAKYFSNSPFPTSLEKVQSGHIKYFRAMHDGIQVGLCGYVLKTPALAETVKTTVFDEFRNKGFGKLISSAIENECKRIGIKKVMTTIFHFNHAMVAIKLAQGYVIEGFHRDHEAPGFHEYSLGKVLI